MKLFLGTSRLPRDNIRKACKVDGGNAAFGHGHGETGLAAYLVHFRVNVRETVNGDSLRTTAYNSRSSRTKQYATQTEVQVSKPNQ